MKNKKNKYLNTDNLVKALFGISIFFIATTYNNIDNNIKDLKNSMVKNEKKLDILDLKSDLKDIFLEKRIKELEKKNKINKNI